MKCNSVVKVLASSATAALMAATLAGCVTIGAGANGQKGTTSPPAEVVALPPGGTSPSAGPTSWAETNSLAADGVVKIATTDCDGLGWAATGFLIAPNLVVTAAHVVEGADTLNLTVAGPSGPQTSAAEVLGKDTTLDVALLRTLIPLAGHVFSFSDQKPKIGQQVAALGFPLGYGYKMNTGGITGVGSPGNDDDGLLTNQIQMDTDTNRGNSGGPLIFMDGTVIGIVIAQLDKSSGNDVSGFRYAANGNVAKPEIESWTTAATVVPLETCSTPTPTSTIEPKVSFPIDIQSTHASAQEIGRLLQWHALAINKQDYKAAFDDFTPKQQTAMGGLNQWELGQQTAQWQSIVLERVTGTGNTLKALASFITHQDAEFGYNNQTCSDFKVNYTVLFVDGRWMIDSAPAAEGFKAPLAC